MTIQSFKALVVKLFLCALCSGGKHLYTAAAATSYSEETIIGRNLDEVVAGEESKEASYHRQQPAIWIKRDSVVLPFDKKLIDVSQLLTRWIDLAASTNPQEGKSELTPFDLTVQGPSDPKNSDAQAAFQGFPISSDKIPLHTLHQLLSLAVDIQDRKNVRQPLGLDRFSLNDLRGALIFAHNFGADTLYEEITSLFAKAVEQLLLTQPRLSFGAMPLHLPLLNKELEAAIFKKVDSLTGSKLLMNKQLKDIFSPLLNHDGTKIAAIEKGGAACTIFDAQTGEIFQTITLRTFFNIFSDEQVIAVAWSPDSSHIAISTSYNHIFIFDSKTTKKTLDIKTTEEVNNLAWSPDGTKIASESAERIAIFNKEGELLQNIAQRSSRGPRTIIWSQDNTKIMATTPDENDIKIFNISTGAFLAGTKEPMRGVPALSQDGTRIMIPRDKGIAVFNSVIQQNESSIYYEGDLKMTGACFSPNGTKITGVAVETGPQGMFIDSRIAICDAHNGKLLASFDRRKYASGGQLSWSLDSARIMATRGYQGGSSDISLYHIAPPSEDQLRGALYNQELMEQMLKKLTRLKR